jgi:hypothetical protein
MIIVHKEYLPAFGLPGIEDQRPVCRYVILSINEKVGDCAAYEGIGPTSNTPELHELIRAGGNKISETEARNIFDEIETMKLMYRR